MENEGSDETSGDEFTVMEVHFGKYRITSDKYQYIFQEYQGTTLDKNGEERERWNLIGYYGRLDHLVKALPDHVIRRSNGNLVEAVAEAQEVGKSLENALTQAGYSI